MRIHRHLIGLSILLGASALSVSWAQEQPAPVGSEAGTASCRCCLSDRVAAPYLRKLKPPTRRDNVGTSHLKITTSSPEAQIWFDQGLNLLHCFWELEAYRCFLRAAELDPDCAMAYWGLCMSLPGKTIEAQTPRAEALAMAKKLAPKASRHEQLYIEGVEILIQQGPPQYTAVLRKILEEFPDDLDARAWLAFFIKDGYFEGTSIANAGQSEALRLLREGIVSSPDHLGCHHYMIHALESGPEFAKAIPNAKRLVELAPGSAHLLHMPGHLAFLQGDFKGSLKSFKASHDFDTAYLKSDEIPAFDHPHYLHNLHYLAMSQAELGQWKDAMTTADTYRSVTLDPARTKPEGRFQQLYSGRALPAKIAMMFGRWDVALAKLEEGPSIEADCQGAALFHEALRTYLRGRIACEAGERRPSAAAVKAMEQLGRNLIAYGKTIELSTERLYHTRSLKFLDILMNELRFTASNVDRTAPINSIHASNALDREKALGYEEPPVLARSSAYSLGEVALQHRQWDKAHDAFTTSLENRPGSPWAILGQARARAGAGRTDEAKALYQQVVERWDGIADADLPELVEAKAAVGK